MKRLFFARIMQNYQLDLTEYLCPMPLLFFKKKSRTYVRPCHVILLLRQESVRDIELLCDEENIFILEKKEIFPSLFFLKLQALPRFGKK